MFNLIVTGQIKSDKRAAIFAPRVLQYTSEEVLQRVQPLGKLDFNLLLRFPTLIMEEGRGEERVYLARLSRIELVGRNYELTYSVDMKLPPLTNREVLEVASDLDIEVPEFSTNHWAVKDRDLFEVLLHKRLSAGPKPSVFQLSDKPVDKRLVSFMMPFSGEFGDVYRIAKERLESGGYCCRRADDIWVHHHIMADIVELICTSAVVVCDLTKKNPNVFYEAGIAHALGKDVVLITQSHDDVPFDLKSIRYIHYLNNNEGRAKLGEELLARVNSLSR